MKKKRIKFNEKYFKKFVIEKLFNKTTKKQFNRIIYKK